MRIIYTLLLLSFLSTQSFSQSEGSFQLEAMTEGSYFWQHDDFSITTGVGLNIWPIEYIGLNYEFQIGYDSRYNFTFNTGWGQVLCGFLFSEFSGSGFGEALGVVAILALACPEGVTFAINPGDELVFMPYLIPLEAQYLHGDGKRFRCSGEVGLKIHYNLGNGMGIRPKLGIRYLYSKYKLGIEVGLGVMLFDTED